MAARVSSYVRQHRRGVLLGVLAVLALVFIAENNGDVTTHFFFFTVTVKLWLGLAICLAAGVWMGYLAASMRERRRDH